MKRFGEWQMRTYRPPGWYKEILHGYPCMEKRGEEEGGGWRKRIDGFPINGDIKPGEIRMGDNPENEFSQPAG